MYAELIKAIERTEMCSDLRNVVLESIQFEATAHQIVTYSAETRNGHRIVRVAICNFDIPCTVVSDLYVGPKL